MLRHFTDALEQTFEDPPERWYAAGLCPLESFLAKYPGFPVKSLKFREGRFLSGALYATSPEGLRACIDLISKLRHNRKSQLALAKRLGFWNMLSYFTGRSRLEDAPRILDRLFEGRTLVIRDCAPETCLDFDSADEYRAISALFPDPESR